ncbi:Uncharacterised protein [Mycobacteroides abscessus subsp. massiliense]|nr:Uncharacterised protein [Mycobacteroides abscessus subsp. massiliense]
MNDTPSHRLDVIGCCTHIFQFAAEHEAQRGGLRATDPAGYRGIDESETPARRFGVTVPRGFDVDGRAVHQKC